TRQHRVYVHYGDYSGVGPGAHGRRNGAFTQRHRKPENWLSGLARNSHGIVEQGDIAAAEKGVEALLMGLRLGEGVDLDRIADLSGRAPVDRNAADRESTR